MTNLDGDELDRRLRAPLLDVPDDFVPRVMSALADRSARFASSDASPASLGWLQTAVAALCGALGAIEVLLFVGGLWLRSPAAFG